MGKLIHNGITYASVNHNAVSPISLIDNYRIGINATTVTTSPLDANNHITVSDKTITYHRNSANYGLWIFTPYLDAGKLYCFSVDDVVNTDMNWYLDITQTINPSGQTAITRVGSMNYSGQAIMPLTRGIIFSPQTSGYYGMVFWSSNTSDISVVNPRITEIPTE